MRFVKASNRKGQMNSHEKNNSKHKYSNGHLVRVVGVQPSGAGY